MRPEDTSLLAGPKNGFEASISRRKRAAALRKQPGRALREHPESLEQAVDERCQYYETDNAIDLERQVPGSSVSRITVDSISAF